MPFKVNEILPVVAPGGTITVMLVAVVEPVTVANVPLKAITFLAGVELKFVPERVTDAPTAPLIGVKPAMVGVGNRVKLVALVIVMPLAVTEIGPVAAPLGTVTVILVADEAVTTAGIPLNETTLLDGVRSKFVPLIIMVAPTAPLAGLRLVIVGVGSTVKLVALVIVMPLTVTDILPVIEPVGTLVTMLVVEDVETTAVLLLLNLTI
jgi:hypothetical protein